MNRRGLLVGAGIIAAPYIIRPVRAQIPMTGAGKGAMPGAGSVSGGGGGGGGTTTLDPNNLQNTVTLSNGNLTATGGNTAYAFSIANHGSGKYYWEATLVTNTNGYNMGLGYSSTSANQLGAPMGQGSVNGGIWANSSDGNFYQNGNVGTASGITFSVNGDIVGMALDIGNSKMWYRVNGGQWNGSNASNNPATNTGGISLVTVTSTMFAMIGFDGALNQASTFNFGATAYNNAAPSGFGNL